MSAGLRTVQHADRGFSLLEMLVAVAILAISLGAMYQVAGGATRTVGIDEKTLYAVELARSLRATHAVVPMTGLQLAGETEGEFRWQVAAAPLPGSPDKALAEGQLQSLHIRVSWPDGPRERAFELESIAAGTQESE